MKRSFNISKTPWDPAALALELDDPQAGGLVTFEGRVRNHNEGKPVDRLEYSCYEEMACSEGDQLLAETHERFEITRALCIHRIGLLEIGEPAVWIGVAAPHRDAAFQACRFIIDELKQRLPIWKKEHYAEGGPEWIAS